MPDAHQDVRWPPNSHVRRKINTGCPARCHVPTKIKAGSLPNVGAFQNTCWVPGKMPGSTQNARCPPKYTLGAHEDARWPTKCHMPTKRNAVCTHRCQVAKKKPCVHQIKVGCLSRCQVGTKRNAGCS